jgi:uncharacterized protein (DUF2141 family)
MLLIQIPAAPSVRLKLWLLAAAEEVVWIWAAEEAAAESSTNLTIKLLPVQELQLP